MTTFNALRIAQTGLGTYRQWIDASADNIANINTIRPTDEPAYQARYIVSEEIPPEAGGGVRSIGALFGEAEGRLAYQPDHPLADDDGLVRVPDMELSDQISSAMVATRAYQANVASFERARDAYLSMLQIGR